MVRALVVSLFSAIASSLAHGAAYVSIVPATPGPYVPGQSLELTVDLFQDLGGEDRLLRLIRLDFSHTDPSIGLDRFAFEFPTIPLMNRYVLFPGLPRPEAVYTGLFPSPTEQLILLGDGTLLHIGRMTVSAPLEPGSYVLDAVTPEVPGNQDFGGSLEWGFGLFPGDVETGLHPLLNAPPVGETDDLNGLGRVFKFSVIPEPATGLMLLLPSLFLARRRFTP